jgi:hypothetical protein
MQKFLAQKVCLLLKEEAFFPSYSWYALKTLQQVTPVV